MMQLLPATAADLGVNPHNVVENVRGGIRYLRDQLAQFGDAAQALAAYNWGPGHVRNAIARWGSEWLSHAPSETQHYVANILSRAGIHVTHTSAYDTILAANHLARASAPPSSSAQQMSQAQRVRLRAALSAYLVDELLG